MRVIGKQKNGRMCYICGMENDAGLKAQFYNMEDGSVMTKFQYKKEHQSYPERVHGGLISAMLDELACRAYWVKDETVIGATLSMEVKFRKPVPYNIDIIGKGIIIKDLSKFFISDVKLTDIDDNIFADGIVKYIKLPPEKIASSMDFFHKEMIYYIEDNVVEI